MADRGAERRGFLRTAAFCAAGLAFALSGRAGDPRTTEIPNVVVIYCDDLGYGDLGCFGHPTIRTPRIDRMAAEGQRWTSFYSASGVCTPSRAALLTGRLPIRSGMCSDGNRVLFHDSTGGLPDSEITLAQAVKRRGYATMCVGKWHLGHRLQFLPTRRGFDSYFGIPYSNDMDQVRERAQRDGVPNLVRNPKVEYFDVPLMRDEQVEERPAEQSTITRRYTDEAVRFIRRNKGGPFFLYLAHTMPHVPLFVSPEARGKSLRGLYGDVVEEIDASVGRVLDALREEGIAERTLVMFASDNGPWLTQDEDGGSAGLLRDGKGSTWEGAMRVPTLFWWPGTVRPGIVSEIGSTLDLFATVCALARTEVPTDRVMDTLDLGPALRGEAKSPRTIMHFYRDTKLYAVRKGPFKAHFFTKPGYGPNQTETAHEPPLLFQLEQDPSERFDVAKAHPDLVADLRREAERLLATVTPAPDQLADRTGKK
jgi:arylsulfatase A-like enzyme